MYKVAIDPARRMVRLVLTGFWTVEEARAFAREQQEAVKRLGPPFGTHLTLVDVRDFAIQTQEVSGVIRDLVRNAPILSRRIALVGGEGLARLQFKRIAERDAVQRFDTSDDAVAWLCS